MGSAFEPLQLIQAKKAQGETNARLAELLVAQNRTNQLLEWIGGLIQGAETELPAASAIAAGFSTTDKHLAKMQKRGAK